MTDGILAHRRSFFLVVFLLLCMISPAYTHDASQQENALLQAAAAQWERTGAETVTCTAPQAVLTGYQKPLVAIPCPPR